MMAARPLPTSAENRFCITPAFKARRAGEDAKVMMARQIGRNGPSTTPISRRAASSDG